MTARCYIGASQGDESEERTLQAIRVSEPRIGNSSCRSPMDHHHTQTPERVTLSLVPARSTLRSRARHLRVSAPRPLLPLPLPVELCPHARAPHQVSEDSAEDGTGEHHPDQPNAVRSHHEVNLHRL